MDLLFLLPSHGLNEKLNLFLDCRTSNCWMSKGGRDMAWNCISHGELCRIWARLVIECFLGQYEDPVVRQVWERLNTSSSIGLSICMSPQSVLCMQIYHTALKWNILTVNFYLALIVCQAWFWALHTYYLVSPHNSSMRHAHLFILIWHMRKLKCVV